MNVFRKYPRLMRPVVFIGLITGVYTLVTLYLFFREYGDEFIEAHHEAVDYIKNGISND